MKEGTEITGGTEERRRTTERGARQRAGAAGPAHYGKNSGNANEQPVRRLCFRRSFRSVTRVAGLSRQVEHPCERFVHATLEGVDHRAEVVDVEPHGFALGIVGSELLSRDFRGVDLRDRGALLDAALVTGGGGDDR